MLSSVFWLSAQPVKVRRSDDAQRNHESSVHRGRCGAGAVASNASCGRTADAAADGTRCGEGAGHFGENTVVAECTARTDPDDSCRRKVDQVLHPILGAVYRPTKSGD